MRNGNQTKSSPLDCEVALALKMQLQPTASYSCDGNGGNGGGGGGGHFFNGSGNQPHAYELMQRSLDYTSSTPSGGMNVNMNMMMMGVCGKALFTSSQLEELERQKMIHKYILASIPVPPQLLLSTSTSPPPSSLSQCNTPGLDLRYSSNGSDPEPWRCKRTDGKKWRCSRDVAGDQKYCERHAHKNRPRSRKHVENSPHTTYSQKPFVLPSNTLQRSTPQFPTFPSTAPYDQTRCIEWLMKGGNSNSNSNSDDASPVSTCKQPQWEQLLQLSSTRMEQSRDNTNKNDNVSVYHPHFAEKQDLMSLNTTQTTRLFIDAWGKEGGDGMSSKGMSAEKKLWPSSSLSLSMCGDEKGDLGIGMMMSSGGDGDGLMLKNQWLNPVSWMNSSSSSSLSPSPPGGPLGEALCLGNANTSRNRGGGGGASNSNTNSSSCSKSSCEDGSHALNFIG